MSMVNSSMSRRMAYLIMTLPVVLMLEACRGPGSNAGAPVGDLRRPHEQFLEAARFSPASAESWWLATPDHSSRVGQGARRLLICGFDFRRPSGDSRTGDFTAICVWDYEGLPLPHSPDLATLGGQEIADSDLDSAEYCFEILRPSDRFRFRRIVEDRFVVGATSQEALSIALEQRGDGKFLACEAMLSAPEHASEIVLHQRQGNADMCCALADGQYRLMWWDLDKKKGGTLCISSEFIEAEAIGRGWFEVKIPRSIDALEVMGAVSLMLAGTWGWILLP